MTAMIRFSYHHLLKVTRLRITFPFYGSVRMCCIHTFWIKIYEEQVFKIFKVNETSPTAVKHAA